MSANLAHPNGFPDPAPGSLKLVIADNDARSRDNLTSMLSEEGFDVVGQATSGEQLVRLVKHLRPDLVVIDAELPNIDGIATADELTGEHIAPIIVVASNADSELVKRARDAGVHGYLVKPLSKALLSPMIEVAVARYAETTQLRNAIADATTRLETRKVIDRAKGLLMAHRGIAEPEAFRWIQRTAMDRRLSSLAVARGVIADLTPGSVHRAAS